MRVSIIALLSVVAGVAAAAVLAPPELWSAAPSEIAPILLPESAAFAVVALAGYAFVALLLTTGTLVGDMIALRSRLARLAERGVSVQDDVAAAFAPSRLARLGPRLAPVSGVATAPDRAAWTPEIVRRGEIRREIMRLHYIWLARGQFFTVLVLLAGFAALRFVPDYSPLRSLPGTIPSVGAFVALGGLILLGGLSVLLIDVTVEPVVEEILELPGERHEIRLLRRMTELAEEARSAGSMSSPGRSEAFPPPRPISDELTERLAIAVEESRRAWLHSVADLSTAAAALQATMSASAESLEASLHATLERLASTTQSSADPGAMAIERLGTSSEEPLNEVSPAKAAPRRGGAADRVVAELATLLREINAKP